MAGRLSHQSRGATSEHLIFRPLLSDPYPGRVGWNSGSALQAHEKWFLSLAVHRCARARTAGPEHLDPERGR